MRPSARTATLLLILSAGRALACPDQAPNPDAGPMTGEINLGVNTSIHPYPFAISTIAGGNFNLRDCGLEGDGLTGYEGDALVAVRPDLVVHWRGGHPELTIAFENEEDTFLLVSDPEGRWLFNEDSEGHNPELVISDPAPGDYAIFVGTHGSMMFTRPGTLTIQGPSS